MASSASDSEESNSPPKEPAKPPRGAKTLVRLAEEALVGQFKLRVKDFNSISNYCCGGVALVPALEEAEAREYSLRTDEFQSPPIVLRWDSSDDNCTRKITFPLPTNAEGLMTGSKDALSFEHLIKATMPNTLKRKRDWFTEYISPYIGILSNDDFSVDFHPNERGILDAVSQILLPIYYLESMYERQEHHGIVARLRGLLVLSGARTSSAHSPTADEDNRLGCLVVRLPHAFAGGQLKVSYKDHSTFFDWSNIGKDTVDWVAFDIQCDIEVSEITDGHRLTLMYDLYISERVGGVFRSLPKAEPKQLPLFEMAKEMLVQPGFMIEGGMFGFYCSHRYDHTSPGAKNRMPFALKGVDATLFAALRALGLKVTVELCWKPLPLLYEYMSDPEEVEAGLTYELWAKSVTYVSKDWEPINCQQYYSDVYWEDIWRHNLFLNVVWLNEPSNWDLAWVSIRNFEGLSPEIEQIESHVVIFIEVPRRGDRDLQT